MNNPTRPEPDEPEPDELTIDELARAVGMTVRNLREWRTLGLLPPPKMRGRSGYYPPSEVERIKGIQRMHAEGFTLELIARLLDAGGDLTGEAMDLAIELRSPFRSEDAPVVDVRELAATWGVTDPADLERSVELGLIRPRPDGRFEFTSAEVARVGEGLARLGLSSAEVLDATSEMRAHLDAIATTFEAVWMKHIWEPFVDDGMPPARVPELHRVLHDVQPLALDAVVGLFAVAMEEAIAEGIAREIDRVQKQHRDLPG
jgi:DNA-binding transcriptional MerR regulator